MPSIRSDLAPPRLRRIDDRQNYGDQSDAWGLTNPSIYSTRGVYEKDLLLPRSENDVSIHTCMSTTVRLLIVIPQHLAIAAAMSTVLLSMTTL